MQGTSIPGAAGDTRSEVYAPTLAEKLHAAAALIEAHPDLPIPCVFAYSSSRTVEVTWQLMNDDDNKADQRTAAAAIVKALGGKWTKEPWGDRFDMRTTRDGLKLEIFAHRDQVCERVVVGTETVVVPAVPAQPERIEERELVEWRCESLLAGGTEGALL
jgi:hypothetical protein